DDRRSKRTEKPRPYETRSDVADGSQDADGNRAAEERDGDHHDDDDGPVEWKPEPRPHRRPQPRHRERRERHDADCEQERDRKRLDQLPPGRPPRCAAEDRDGGDGRRHAPAEHAHPISTLIARTFYLWHPTQLVPFALGIVPVASHCCAFGVWPEVGASCIKRSKYARALSGRPSRAEPSARPKSSSPFAWSPSVRQIGA